MSKTEVVTISDSEGLMQKETMQKWRYALLVAISAGYIAFQLYIALIRPFDRWIQVPIHLAFGLIAAFMFSPIASKCKTRLTKALGWTYDIVLISMVLYIAYYFLSNLTYLQNRIYNVDTMTSADLLAAYLLVFVVMEAVRRAMGLTLFIFIAVFILYAFVGQKIPGVFQFRGMTWQGFAELMVMDVNGILGSPLTTSMNTLFYFLLFGAFFSVSGGGQVLIDLGMKLSDKTVGGPAKAAVLSSSLMGMISGSAVANVTTTGVLTIPLMKKAGYEPHQAGSIEAIASTGGQIMPPIMGIGAFIMAEMIGVPYLKIAASAVIPALAYYGSVFLLVHFLAKKKHMTAKNTSVKYTCDPILPRVYQILPIVGLVYIIVTGGSLTRAALVGTGLSIFVSFISKKTRMNVRQFISATFDGVKQAANIAIPTAAIGIMIGIVVQSGVTNKLTKIIANTGESNLWLALVLAMIGNILLGMALPTVAAYLIANILFATTLINLGLPPLVANMFIFYFSAIAQITPPVCLASFTAAGIAKASSWKTGWTAFAYALVAFLVPYVFVFQPELLLVNANVVNVSTAVAILAWGILFLAGGISGYMLKPVDNIILRSVFVLAAILIILPNMVMTVAGSIIGVIAFAVNLTLVKRQEKKAVAAA